MKRKLRLKICDERTEWKCTHHLDSHHSVELEDRSYTCPICKQRQETILLDGSVLHGGSGTLFSDGHQIDHCATMACATRAERLAKGWRRALQEKIDDARHFLAGRFCRWAARLRREKWYEADAFHGVRGNRVSELHQRIFQWCVWKGGYGEIEGDLKELAQRAGEAWGHEA